MVPFFQSAQKIKKGTITWAQVLTQVGRARLLQLSPEQVLITFTLPGAYARARCARAAASQLFSDSVAARAAREGLWSMVRVNYYARARRALVRAILALRS